MNLQAFIDEMNEQDSRARANYHLTLGGLKDALENAPDSLPVVFNDGVGANYIDSYRGYYTDLAISDCKPVDPIMSVAEWRGVVEEALATTFQGYKGGDYPATPGKPLWRSEWGKASSEAIIDVRVESDRFVLMTKRIDD